MSPAKKVGHRPYARLRNKPERSVTEIIGLKAIDGLPWAAAKETARQAVRHPESWQSLEEDAAVDYLRKFHRGIWDARAANGTATHAVMEAWVDGTTVDLYDLVCDMAENDYQAVSWRGNEAEATERLGLYVDGLEKFWHDWSPEGCVSEQCVRMPGVYIGQRDLGATCRGLRVLHDIKTTAERDGEKGVYHDSWALQLAGYDKAPEIVHYGFDEKDKIVETGTEPNEPHDSCRVIHLRGDGGYSLYEVDAGEQTFRQFLGLAAFNTWLRDLGEPKALNPTEEAS